MIRSAVIEDAPAILGIYSHYVRETVVTFETVPPSVEEMRRRIASISAEYPFFVLEDGGEIRGYAYASRWHRRAAYGWTVESSISVREDLGGRGIGTELYERLLRSLRDLDIHAVVGCIALPNEPSRRLHERFGFEESGRLPQVGRKFDRWVDVGSWTLILEGPKFSSR
jgi:phosphinothricin acetyltransferase